VDVVKDNNSSASIRIISIENSTTATIERWFFQSENALKFYEEIICSIVLFN